MLHEVEGNLITIVRIDRRVANDRLPLCDGPKRATADGNRLRRVKRAIYVAPFGELADPRILAELAVAAEERGWDGFFVWDHILYRAPVRAVADPWVALAAVACATRSLRIGPLITPLARRRVHKVARETVTLDLLSSGRLTLGVGLGGTRNGELEPFGEVVDPIERARLLDQGLDDLVRYWAGEFQPVPVQQPRIPVWVAAVWPHRRPYDGHGGGKACSPSACQAPKR